MIDRNKLNRTMAFLKENAFSYYANDNRGLNGRWQDEMYKALLHSLSEEELEQLEECLDSDPDCPRALYYKAAGVMKARREVSMAAVDTSTLLAWYADKKSGKVGLATKSLMLKYPKECVEAQQEILKAFIMGGKKELEWAARRLRDRWMASLTPYVDRKWKSTRNPILGYVVLRHFPDEYILEEQEPLAEVTSYAYICARLGNVKGFHMDSNRLSTPEALYVFAKWDMEKSTALNIGVVADGLLNAYLDEEDSISSRDMGLILWSLGKLGLTDTIIRILPEIRRKASMNDFIDSLIDEVGKK